MGGRAHVEFAGRPIVVFVPVRTADLGGEGHGR